MQTLDLRICDIMKLPLDRAQLCDLTFTDPPWEQGLVKMFETMQFKQTGIERPQNDIDSILDRLASLIPIGQPAFIEYSVKGHERVVNHMEHQGHTLTRVQPAIQTNGMPYVYVCFNTDIPACETEPGGWDFLKMVLDHHKPEWVFEPFAGQGQHTSRMIKHGVKVRASELNPHRASKIRKACGFE